MSTIETESMFDKTELKSLMKHKEIVNNHLAMTMASNGDNDLFHQEQRRNEREKIRKKLAAVDSDNEDSCIMYDSNGSRTSSGVNLQMCFINDTGDYKEMKTYKNSHMKQYPARNRINNTIETSIQNSRNNPSHPAQSFPYWQRPSYFFNRQLKLLQNQVINKKEKKLLGKEDIIRYHNRLQSEVRIALSQAKDVARMQMIMERQQRKLSPLSSLIGITFPEGWCRLDADILNKMNLAQIQVIVNDLHSQIENLNDELVRLLLERDDLHMEQDSKLVDIEDLTQYLGLKGTREK